MRWMDHIWAKPHLQRLRTAWLSSLEYLSEDGAFDKWCIDAARLEEVKVSDTSNHTDQDFCEGLAWLESLIKFLIDSSKIRESIRSVRVEQERKRRKRRCL